MSYQRKEVIGDATLYLGDCVEVLPTLGKVDAVITDPPYGIPHRFGTQNKIDGKRSLSFEWDGEHINEIVFNAVSMCADLADAHFWFCGYTQVSEIALRLRSAGLVDKMAAWVKDCPPPAMPGNWWPSGFEVAVYAYRPGAWFGDTNTKRTNVFRGDSYRHGQPGKEDHPTQKPIKLMGELVRSLCKPSGTLLDAFMGSGSAGVAAMHGGRAFVGIEKEIRYFDIACRRIEQANKQGHLFAPETKKSEQIGMELE